MDRLAAEPTAYETEAEPEGQEQGNNRPQAVTPCRLAHDRSGWRHPGGAAERPTIVIDQEIVQRVLAELPRQAC